MNLFKKPMIFLAVAMLAIPVSGFSQYKFQVAPFWSYFKDLQRYEIGFSYILPAGEYSGVTQVRDGNNNYYGDTTIKRKLTGSQAFGASIGISVPFTGLGHISCLAMDVQLMISQYEWDDLNETYALGGNSFSKPSTPLNAVTQQVSLPIGISYHVGCDVIKTRRLPLGAAFGVGLIPQYNMTALEGVNNSYNGSSISVTPYAKAEFAFLFGICFKIRAMYTMGNVPLMDVNTNLGKLTDGPFSIGSTSNLSLSLILMPFSFSWHETDWYNTYDTYNRYDKLN